MGGVVTLTDIEIGPHYLTVWGHKHANLLKLAEWAYPEFLKLREDLSQIQQFKFRHESEDPNVYHRLARPRDIKPEGPYSHFHVRYGYRPTLKDVAELRGLLGRCRDPQVDRSVSPRVWQTESRNHTGATYPEIRNAEQYEDYIHRLRIGKTDA